MEKIKKEDTKLKKEAHERFIVSQKLSNILSIVPKGESFMIETLSLEFDCNTWLTGKHASSIEKSLNLGMKKDMSNKNLVRASSESDDDSDEIINASFYYPNISSLAIEGKEFNIGFTFKNDTLPDANVNIEHLLAIESKLKTSNNIDKSNKIIEQLESTSLNPSKINNSENKAVHTASVKVETSIIQIVPVQTIWDKEIVDRQAMAKQKMKNNGTTIWDREIQEMQKFLQKVN